MQPDFYNSDFRNFVADYMSEYFSSNPDRRVLSLGYADSSLFDTSQKTLESRRGYNGENYADYSNAVFDFTNFEAKILKKKYPDKLVMQTAYLYTLRPPDFRLSDNILVYYASDRGNWFDKRRRDFDIATFAVWTKSGAALGIHDYNFGMPYFIPRETSFPHA